MTTEAVGYSRVKVPKDPSTKGVLFIRNLPKVVKLQFKANVARRGDTMERVILELLRKYNDDPQCIDRWVKKRRKKK
jgi:hypothetical protein